MSFEAFEVLPIPPPSFFPLLAIFLPPVFQNLYIYPPRVLYHLAVFIRVGGGEAGEEGKQGSCRSNQRYTYSYLLSLHFNFPRVAGKNWTYRRLARSFF